MVGEFDFDGAVVLELGGALSGDLGHVVRAVPAEEDGAPSVFVSERRGECSDRDLAVSAVVEGDRRRTEEVENLRRISRIKELIEFIAARVKQRGNDLFSPYGPSER